MITHSASQVIYEIQQSHAGGAAGLKAARDAGAAGRPFLGCAKVVL
jgi:hypothetical protein